MHERVSELFGGHRPNRYTPAVDSADDGTRTPPAFPIATLSIYWFLYFTGLGIFYPFYSLYLRDNAGLSGTQVGIVMATLPLVGMVAQPLWGRSPIGAARKHRPRPAHRRSALGYTALTS
jgi:MFS family permease